MQKITLFLSVYLLCYLSAVGQNNPYYPYRAYYETAYSQFPNLPKGMLEAVAYTNTHNRFVTPQDEQSCSGMPKTYGLFGLVEDGKGYFNNNLQTVSSLSGIAVNQIKSNPQAHLLAYAGAINNLAGAATLVDYAPVLLALSELPRDGQSINHFASNSFLYGVFTFLNDADKAATYQFSPYQINLPAFFGQALYDKLSSKNVNIAGQRSADYGPALWVAASTCNFSSRNSTPVSAVVVHTIQGSYASAISWFGNCAAQVSAHYVIRSSDGQVTQTVNEADKGWHVGSENSYTIGIEHEGFVNDPSWYTAAMYQSSANLVKDICQSGYGINPLSTYRDTFQTVVNSCYNIKGHVHYPSQTHTDPGSNWDWSHYYDLINDSLTVNRMSTCSGLFTDSGDTTANHGDLENYWTVIEPAGASTVTIDFSQFDLEAGYDFLYLYDGDENTGSLIGTYTGTNSPGIVTAYSGKMAIMFESDCRINNIGWQATWDCQLCANPFVVMVDSLLEPNCNGSTGYMALSVVGGSAPYTFLWPNGSSGSINSSLTAGSYALTVIDSAGCTNIENYTINTAGNLSPVIQKENNICFNDAIGVIAVSVSGGSMPYTYQWQHGDTGFLQTRLAAGQYTLTITDNTGCTAVSSTTITQGTQIVIEGVSTNVYTGQITITSVSGGVPPYNYRWANGQQLATASNLNAGWHSITITGDAGCAIDTVFYLGSPTGIETQDGASFSIYPNPSEGNISINCGYQCGRFKLYNTLGQIMLDTELNSAQNTINLQHLTKGLYFAEVGGIRKKVLLR